jgi:hypothetical protein
MPIRFRCENCGQLLGIARRKAGTHVNCPSCFRDVLVPAEDQAEARAAVPAPVPVQAQAGAPPLFERDDFDELLRPAVSMAPEAPALRYPHAPAPPPPPLAPAPRSAYAAPEQGWQSGEPAGLVLSPSRATALTVVVILMLAMSFGAGLLVGRFYL